MKRRRQPDVRKIKKHSQIVKSHKNTMVVGGHRERTSTGYVVPGFSGKSFETRFETMLSGTSSDLLLHEKKDKVIRVLSGRLFVLTHKGEKSSESVLVPGDEVAIERGTQYRISTMNEDAEFLVCQSASYEKTLQVVDECSVTRDVPVELLEPLSPSERLSKVRSSDALPRRKGSKAKEQARAARGLKPRETNTDIAGPEDVSVVAGMNPKPTGGAFSEEGAG